MTPRRGLRHIVRSALVVTAWMGTAAAHGSGPDLDALFPHEHGGRVVFTLKATPDAQVALIGDFNQWDDQATPMRHTGDGIFEAAIALDPGSYQYKFVVNGRRRLDPSNPEEASAPDGSINSRLVVLHDNRVSERSHWQRRPSHRSEPAFRPSSTQDFAVGATVSFNRVDGTTLWLRPSYRANNDFTPEFETSFAYGWESERVSVDADVAQPVAPNRLVLLGLHFVNGTACDNQAEVGLGENTIAALLFKHDFADYYDIRGYEPYVRLHLPAHSTLRVAYASEDYASLTAQTQWSVFSAGRERFRPNPPLFLLGEDPRELGGEGRLEAARVEWVTDTRRAQHVGTVGFYGRGFLEVGGGDFDYTRWVADGRAYLRLGRPVHLAMRLRSGARIEGNAIPSQKLFYLGGLGTVRGHPFRAQMGDREILGNLEYTFLFNRLDHGIVLFYDGGTAWNSDVATLQDATVLQAVGVGFKTTNDDFQVNFAKPVGAVKGGIETTVRLNRTF